jgi:hypothetical protein
MPEPLDPERLERLLRGYALPETSVELDQRVLEHGIAIVTEPRGALFADVAHAVLHHIGLGPVAWLVDLVTHTDAEYRVELA